MTESHKPMNNKPTENPNVANDALYEFDAIIIQKILRKVGYRKYQLTSSGCLDGTRLDETLAIRLKGKPVFSQSGL